MGRLGHDGFNSLGAQKGSLVQAKGKNPFGWLLLGRGAPVVGFDSLFVCQKSAEAKEGRSLGVQIEATIAGRATAAEVRHEVKALHRILDVSILAAHSLGRSQHLDPCVVIRAGACEWQTPAVANDGDPIWTSQNQFTIPIDSEVELLEFEVVNANGKEPLGKASLSVPDLRAGVVHRRRMPLEGTLDAELSVHVQCREQEEVTPSSPSRRPCADPEEETPGLRLCLPQDWEGSDEESVHLEVERVRSKTADLFGELRLEVDPVLGPAERLHRAFAEEAPSKSYLALASMHEEMYMSKTALSGQVEEASRLQDAIQKAVAKEKAVEERVQDDLKSFLKKLQELEDTAKVAEVSAAGDKTEDGAPQPSAQALAQCGPPKPSPSAVPERPAETLPPAAAVQPSRLHARSDTVQMPKEESKAPIEKKVPPQVHSLEDRYAVSVASVHKAEQSLKDLKTDASSKDFRNEAKKLINTRVGQISATWSRIQECTAALCGLLSTHSQDPKKKIFVEHAVAMRIADDAEVSVRSQPRAAWSIAEVSCRVFDKFPSVQELFIGLMCRECPYLRADFSTQEAAVKRPNEAFTEMVDRMVSYHRLWIAIFCTQGELSIIWNWLARTLNHPPSTAAVAMLHATLDMVGAEAQARYKKQFDKLILYIDNRYLAEAALLFSSVKGEEADRLRASHNRLSRWVHDFKLRGRAMPQSRQIQTHESELNPHI